jgi:hypothetical protein
MYSLYRDKRRTQNKAEVAQSAKKLSAHKQRQIKLSEKSYHRVDSWAAECLNDELWTCESYSAIRNGATPLQHPANHKFREDDLGSKANIYSRR